MVRRRVRGRRLGQGSAGNPPPRSPLPAGDFHPPARASAAGAWWISRRALVRVPRPARLTGEVRCERAGVPGRRVRPPQLPDRRDAGTAGSGPARCHRHAGRTARASAAGAWWISRRALVRVPRPARLTGELRCERAGSPRSPGAAARNCRTGEMRVRRVLVEFDLHIGGLGGRLWRRAQAEAPDRPAFDRERRRGLEPRTSALAQQWPGFYRAEPG